MSTRLFVLVAMATASMFSFADGLPFNKDKTHLVCKVEILKLSPEQQTQVSRSRVLKLTNSQWIRLLKIAKGCPQTLKVLTNRYDDCTCGMSSFAVWFKPGEVEVPIHSLPSRPMTKEEIVEFDIDTPKSPDIVIDERIQIWHHNKNITEKELQKMLVKWSKQPPSTHQRMEDGQIYVYIDTPPSLSSELEVKLAAFVARMRTFAANHQMYLFVSGYRAIGQ